MTHTRQTVCSAPLPHSYCFVRGHMATWPPESRLAGLITMLGRDDIWVLQVPWSNTACHNTVSTTLAACACYCSGDLSVDLAVRSFQHGDGRVACPSICAPSHTSRLYLPARLTLTTCSSPYFLPLAAALHRSVLRPSALTARLPWHRTHLRSLRLGRREMLLRCLVEIARSPSPSPSHYPRKRI